MAVDVNDLRAPASGTAAVPKLLGIGDVMSKVGDSGKWNEKNLEWMEVFLGEMSWHVLFEGR